MTSDDWEDTVQSELPTGVDYPNEDRDELKPFRREREDYLFKYEGLVNVVITTGLLIGAHIELISIWWLFGFFAITVIPQEVNKIREHGIKKYLGVLNFKKPGFKDVGTIVIGLVVIFAMLLAVTYITITALPQGESNLQQGGHLISDASFNLWIWGGAVIIMYLLVGPLEEYLFRHKLQNILKKRAKTVSAIIITNTIFSVIHLPFLITTGDPINYILPLVTIGLIGIVLSIQYEYTDNLATPSITHSTYNSIILTIIFVHQGGLI